MPVASDSSSSARNEPINKLSASLSPCREFRALWAAAEQESAIRATAAAARAALEAEFKGVWASAAAVAAEKARLLTCISCRH